MITASEHLILQYDPLTLTNSIRQLGGSIKQVYYANSGMYMPNRQLTPLTLQPVIIVTDPNGLIPTGDKSGQLASSAWYVGSISDANRVAVLETAATSTTPFALGSNGSIVVRKNVVQESPVLLIFEAEYYDSRRGSNVHVSLSELLTTTANSESTPAPALSLNKPAGWVHNPLKGMANQTIEAQIFRIGSAVPDANTRYWWYIVENGTERLVGSDVLDLFYVSGQNTRTLTVNPEFMKKVHFLCKAQYYTGSAPSVPDASAAIAETKFIRRFPASLYGQVNVRTGNIVHPSVTSIKLQAVMGTKAGEISNPDKYFYFRWLRNALTPGSTDVEIGHGSNLACGREVAGVNGAQTPRITFTATEHDEYRALTDKSGAVLTDKDGTILVGF